MRRAIGILVCLSLLSGLAAAEDQPPKSLTHEQAADAVLGAVKAGNGEALKALAEKDNPDPWLVADELCHRGERDSARAFAQAAPRHDTKRLPAYIVAQELSPTPAALHLARLEIERARGADEAMLVLAGLAALGNDVDSILLLSAKAEILGQRNQMKEAAQVHDEAAALAEGLGWFRRLGHHRFFGGVCAYYAADLQDATRRWRQGLEVATARGDRYMIGRAHIALGNAVSASGNQRGAIQHWQLALAEYERIRDGQAMGVALGNLGNAWLQLGEPDRAIDLQKRALALKREAGDRPGIAATLGNLGVLYVHVGELQLAGDSYAEALALAKDLGDDRAVAKVKANLGTLHLSLGNLTKAKAMWDEAYAIQVEVRDARGAALTLINMALVRAELGDINGSLKMREQSYNELVAIGDRVGAGLALSNIAVAQYERGHLAQAFVAAERALRLMREVEDAEGISRVLGNLGLFHAELGEYERAHEYQAEAVRLKERTKDHFGLALALVQHGATLRDLERFDESFQALSRAEAIYRESGNGEDRAGVAWSLSVVERLRGHEKEAAEWVATATRLVPSMRSLRARTDLALHLACARLEKQPATVLPELEVVLAQVRTLHDAALEVKTLTALATTHILLGNPQAGIARAREAVGHLPEVLGGHSEEQGVQARTTYADLFVAGAEASLLTQDDASLWFFLENGRSGSLCEALRHRGAIAAATVPLHLRAAEREAKAKETVAAEAYRRALDAREPLQIVRRLRQALEDAQQTWRAAIERTQREAKAGADLLYLAAAEESEVQGLLAKDETLVVYGLLAEHAVARVLARGKARTVRLGSAGEIEAACQQVRLDDPGEDPTAALAVLQDKLVKPLGLPAESQRVLVSPSGVLASVPFALLLPTREVTYVASGTTLRLLAADLAKRGQNVLAVADPAYRETSTAGVDSGVVLAAVRGGRGALPPLPGTRDEAIAVGSTVLMGKRATESAFRAAVANQERWRSVHFACHGLLDDVHPWLSCLALTPDAEDDGFLTVLDVFGIRVPADLVMLSACNSGRGKVVRGEGIIGLTRAFMFAGAPRVICSLWKVDDEATKALMIKFYELWNPKDGQGLGAAAALKAAQEHVRSQDKWKHPYYWAAWVLWGLPD